MPIKPFFSDFEPDIRARFDWAKQDAGAAAQSISLELDEKPAAQRARAEFAAFPAKNLVRVTWAGIASLWACSQALARVARRMFEGSRTNQKTVPIEDGSELETGLNLLELSKRLCSQDLRLDDAGNPRWVGWAPRPVANPNNDDDANGNNLFFGALAWIFRHEIAHITLNHDIRPNAELRPLRDYEREADDQATDWFCGTRKPNASRQAGTPPGPEELEMERRGVVIAIAIVWIAIFEIHFARPSPDHPAVAERLFNSFERIHLREDSGAAEIAAHSIQALIDPQGTWAPADKPFSNAMEFFREAAVRLHRHMQALV